MLRKFVLGAFMVVLPAFVSTESKAAGNSNEYCREYTKTVTVGGKPERAYGTACYRPDGSWEIVKMGGDTKAQEQVKKDMYNDIERYASRHGYRDVNKVVVVETYRNFPPRRYPHMYHSYYRNGHHHYNSPVMIVVRDDWNVDFGRRYHNDNYRYDDRDHRGRGHDKWRGDGHHRGHDGNGHR